MRMTKQIVGAVLGVCLAHASFAGNTERIGQAGASELLINPWARSSGMGGSGTAFVNGVEAFNLNISGLTAINKTELYFTNVSLFTGSDISINSLALGQRVGESSVLGISVNTMSFGELDITTTDNPEGGQGTFSPQYLNFSVGYARAFSNSIYGGGAIRIVSESISNVSAQGVALDAGIRYLTGKADRMKFGIAIRNVGPKMRYSGDGLSETVLLQDAEFTVNQRAESFEMPALLNIGASYDLYVGGNGKTDDGAEAADEGGIVTDYRLTFAGNFTSNSFSQDQIRVGAEFGFREYIAVRAGYVYEAAVLNTLEDGRLTAMTGPTLGMSLMLPFKNENSGASFDYSYRFSNPLGGTHSFGIRLSI